MVGASDWHSKDPGLNSGLVFSFSVKGGLISGYEDTMYAGINRLEDVLSTLSEFLFIQNIAVHTVVRLYTN